ncbi:MULTISPECIES: VOC family protein [Streptomyces]|jgi:catechol-2,3-dioxygenase|uniref:Glyoxalase/bleomycin resistance protein/dioxygenase n=4 Tax=Streptomyces griseoaurantiacus TaxID=68213 RepID=F3NCG8_9ACTN|nr:MULTISPECIES: VOC family protein [Streptomyces]EGG48871.1 glyoxalase/bleomycin resistance protein/dioxygenase [Streptomyces griseoaurantiacus M045]SDG91511.1 Glyoxalase/Bleomycin resistance protein/Dioxygenase superfamily protein [Streptomyces jietaisiensis]
MTRTPPVKLAHIVLRTTRFVEMKEWYKLVLMAAPVFEDDHLSFLTYDEEHHRIAVLGMNSLDEPRPGTAGVDHVAFTFADLQALAANYEFLKGRGISPYWCINHGPTTAMYYRDPDGNQLELQIDNFDTDEELERFFATGAFDANPAGLEFDPEVLVSELAGGVPVDELRRRDHWMQTR